jgi:hypothetical protein
VTSNPDGPAIPRPLLDPFTEDATRRLREALDAARVSGDYAEVGRVSNHLAAEGDVSADQVLAIGLFRLSVAASEAGDKVEAEWLLSLIKILCSPEAGRTALVGGFIAAGFGQGWLPAHAYDAMISAVYPSGEIDTSTEFGQAIARIERKHP